MVYCRRRYMNELETDEGLRSITDHGRVTLAWFDDELLSHSDPLRSQYASRECLLRVVGGTTLSEAERPGKASVMVARLQRARFGPREPTRSRLLRQPARARRWSHIVSSTDMRRASPRTDDRAPAQARAWRVRPQPCPCPPLWRRSLPFARWTRPTGTRLLHLAR